MEEDQEKNAQPDPDVSRTPVIPPPNLAPPPPAPSSPLDSARPASPASVPPVGNPSARVEVGSRAGEIPFAPIGLAPFNTRLIAVVIDLIVAFGTLIALLYILPGFASRGAYLVYIGYLLTRDSLPFLGGQSVGKKAMKIRAVTLDGQPLTGKWEPSLIRNGVLLIPFFALVEIFMLLTRDDGPERGRRLGDEWAKTKVIHEPRPEVREDIV